MAIATWKIRESILRVVSSHCFLWNTVRLANSSASSSIHSTSNILSPMRFLSLSRFYVNKIILNVNGANKTKTKRFDGTFLFRKMELNSSIRIPLLLIRGILNEVWKGVFESGLNVRVGLPSAKCVIVKTFIFYSDKNLIFFLNLVTYINLISFLHSKQYKVFRCYFFLQTICIGYSHIEVPYFLFAYKKNESHLV